MTVARCPICLTTATITREHVWPRWFLKQLDDAAPPPFGWSINGVPINDRYGNQIKGEHRQRVMLDICGPCNTTMNTTIEVPAQPTVTALALNGWRGRYRRKEWRAVGLWWAKVLLLAAHEEARLENPRLQNAITYTFEPPMPDIRWLTDGTGMSNYVSVFVHNADMTIADTEFNLSIPAQVNFDNGRTAYCHVLSMATSGLCVTVVSHPGIKSPTRWWRSARRGNCSTRRHGAVTSAGCNRSVQSTSGTSGAEGCLRGMWQTTANSSS